MTIGDIKKSLMVLLDDIGRAEEALEEKPEDKFFRRIYVKNTFSYIEGSIWVLKQVCTKAKPLNGIRRMTPGEFNILTEVSFDLKSNGVIKESVKFIKLPENFRFIFKTINKLFNAAIEIDYSKKDWQNFIETQKVRNRLTHPKQISDLDISDDEIEVCKSVCHWFNDLVHQCFKAFLLSSEHKAK